MDRNMSQKWSAPVGNSKSLDLREFWYVLSYRLRNYYFLHDFPFFPLIPRRFPDDGKMTMEGGKRSKFPSPPGDDLHDEDLTK